MGLLPLLRSSAFDVQSSRFKILPKLSPTARIYLRRNHFNLMKKLFPLVLAAVSLLTPAFAAEQASDNTARAIILKKEELKGKTVTVDVAMVTRLKLDAKKSEAIGTVLFAAHTYDTKSNTRGGSILVAVAKEEADAFAKRYGTTVDDNAPGRRRDIETKALRAPLVLVKGGHCLLDVSGKVADAIKNNKTEAVEAAVVDGAAEAEKGDRPGKR